MKAFGIGGGGGNTVNCLCRKEPDRVELYLLNTDKQVLGASPVANKIGIGQNLTRGLGAGGNPDVGKEAALESEDAIRDLVQGTDLLFLAAGMGGGTGTGGTPEIARIAREEGILTVAVITLPFFFEGKRRMKAAAEGVEQLKSFVDTSIIIENEKVLPLISKSSTLQESFKIVDDILCGAVIAITDLINKPGLINLDFADLKTVLKDGGSAFMVTGSALGQERGKIAAEKAIQSPLMKRSSLKGARKIIINISGNTEMTLDEVDEAASIVHEKSDGESHIIIGTVVDETMGDELRVTVIATDFNDAREGKRDVETPAWTRAIGSMREDHPRIQRVPSTVLTQYESTTGQKFVVRESNLEYPAFLRKKKASFGQPTN